MAQLQGCLLGKPCTAMLGKKWQGGARTSWHRIGLHPAQLDRVESSTSSQDPLSLGPRAPEAQASPQPREGSSLDVHWVEWGGSSEQSLWSPSRPSTLRQTKYPDNTDSPQTWWCLEAPPRPRLLAARAPWLSGRLLWTACHREHAHQSQVRCGSLPMPTVPSLFPTFETCGLNELCHSSAI